jgi:hypothetical protein
LEHGGDQVLVVVLSIVKYHFPESLIGQYILGHIIIHIYIFRLEMDMVGIVENGRINPIVVHVDAGEL